MSTEDVTTHAKKIGKQAFNLKQAEMYVKKLNRLQEVLPSYNTINEKLKHITDEIVNIFHADFARIWMIKEGDLCDQGCIHASVTEGADICENRDQCLHLVASSGRYPHLDGSHRRVPYGCYKIGRVAAGNDVKFLSNDVANDPRVHDHQWARRHNLVSFAGYRLLSTESKPIGVLALFSKQTITPYEDPLFESIAISTAKVIQAKTVEESLLESEEKYRNLFHNAQVGLGSSRISDGKILECNEKMANIFGYKTRAEFISGFVFSKHYVDPNIREEMKRKLKKHGVIRNMAVQLYRKDGDIVWIRFDVQAFPEKGYFEDVVVDITEQKIAEEERKKLIIRLQKAQKMEAIGTLAGGVAHDLNNILSGIVSFPELIYCWILMKTTPLENRF